jgi:DNA-binding HxlR family transcriptional regulator
MILNKKSIVKVIESMPQPAAPRSYNDPCGIARALDLVGERWALLVVRELLLGPKRFTQLRRGLHEASPNVLSQRLRELERAGIVRRFRLGPPASALVYELTERGYDLEPILIALGRWGSRTPLTSVAELGVDALMIALKTRFQPEAAGDLRASYEVRLDEDRFRVEVANGCIDVARASADAPTAIVETDAATLRSVIFGGQPLANAVGTGRLKVITGKRRAVTRFVDLFAAPRASVRPTRSNPRAAHVP